MKLWGGRFAQGDRDPQFEKFSESFSVDQRLIQYDLRVNQVYVRALVAAEVLTPAEARRLTRGLKSIERAVQQDPGWSRGKSAEDVHTWVEQRLEAENELLRATGRPMLIAQAPSMQPILQLIARVVLQ